MRGCETKALSKEAPASLVPSFLDLLQPLSCVMTCPTFDSFVTALAGWAFARRRTVTGMILAAGAVGTGHKHHSACHRVFAAARWSLDELGLAVFGLILPLLEGEVLLAVDDTLARKRGLKVFGVGMHHDPLLSTRKTALTNWAHCWVVLGVLLKLPFCGDRWFCLPVLLRLYVPKKTARNKGLAYRTKPQLAVQMLRLLCGRHESRRFHAVGDSSLASASRWSAQPAPPGNPGRLRKMHAPSTSRVRQSASPSWVPTRTATPFLRPTFANCQRSSGISSASCSVRRRSPLSEKCAPYEQHPWTSSGAGAVRTPWHPAPKMQSHDDSRKVTSTSQIRPSSTGSSNDTHSLVGPFATGTPLLLDGSLALPRSLASRRDIRLARARALGERSEDRR